MANRNITDDQSRFQHALRFILNNSDAIQELTEPPAAEAGFPGAATGRVAGLNGLYRTNWFNGRLLTADALRADQIYGDTRARMVAQMHPAGIAWGLTLGHRAEATNVVVVRPERRPLPPWVTQDSELLSSAERVCALYHQQERTPDDAWVRDALDRTRVLAQLDVPTFRAWCDPAPTTSGGLPLGTCYELAPGLAFDDLGRPISVGATFGFTFTDLVQRYRTRPTVVLDGGTQFVPCACIAPLPPGSVPAGPSLPEGPYLLLIFPIEEGEGRAKVQGNACAGASSSEACEVEGWRGGFELQLSRLRIEAPVEGWTNAWDLRGMLSAWYFDLYEHDLRSRYNRTGAAAPFYPNDPATWEGPGPAARVESGVPLALVYVGSDGSISFVDEWIPRRPITSTGGAAWAANVRGAPTPAARVARVHQFQTMLQESLAAAPFVPGQKGDWAGPNLFERGFRHIPPWGLLPVREPPTPSKGGSLYDLLTVERKAVAQAKADAKAYFARTNVVVTSTFVALHDDDILEDIRRVDEKDPVSLQRREPTLRHHAAIRLIIRKLIIQAAQAGQDKPAGTVQVGRIALAVVVLNLLDRVAVYYGDLTLEQFISREVEVVRFIIPMEPKRRVFPIVGMTSSDPLQGLFAAWVPGANTPDHNWVRELFGETASPRRFVLYVKERLVLLDFFYFVLDLALDVLEVVSRSDLITKPVDRRAVPISGAAAVEPGTPIEPVEPNDSAVIDAFADTFLTSFRRSTNNPPIPLTVLRSMAEPLRARAAATASVLLATDGALSVAATVLRSAFPELALAGTWTAFAKAQQRSDGVASRDAKDDAIDAFAEEQAGFGVLKAAALVLPDATFDALVAELGRTAVADPGGTTLGTAHFVAPAVVQAPAERFTLRALRDTYAERPLTDLVDNAPIGLRVEDALSARPADLKATLKAPGAKAAAIKIAADANVLRTNAASLAKLDALQAGPFYVAFDEAVASLKGGDPLLALKALEKNRDEGIKAAAAGLGAVAPTLGAGGLERLVARLRTSAEG